MNISIFNLSRGKTESILKSMQYNLNWNFSSSALVFLFAQVLLTFYGVMGYDLISVQEQTSFECNCASECQSESSYQGIKQGFILRSAQ